MPACRGGYIDRSLFLWVVVTLNDMNIALAAAVAGAAYLLLLRGAGAGSVTERFTAALFGEHTRPYGIRPDFIYKD